MINFCSPSSPLGRSDRHREHVRRHEGEDRVRRRHVRQEQDRHVVRGNPHPLLFLRTHQEETLALEPRTGDEAGVRRVGVSIALDTPTETPKRRNAETPR